MKLFVKMSLELQEEIETRHAILVAHVHVLIVTLSGGLPIVTAKEGILEYCVLV